MRLSVADRACIRCRERRVKCDKGRPGCQKCAKRGLECTGYDLSHEFKDAGPTVRERYGPKESANSCTTLPPTSQTQSSPQTLGRSTETAAVRTANDGSASHAPTATQALNAPLSASADLFDSSLAPQDELSNLQNVVPVREVTEDQAALSARMDAGIDDAFFDIDPDLYYSIHDNACGILPGQVPPIFRDSDVWEFNTLSSEQLSAIASPGLSLDVHLQADQNDMISKADEVAHLTMHYIEALAPWLDIFDEHMYFSRVVPARAIENPLLRSCISAFAAKQLGRLTANPLFHQRDRQRPTILRLRPFFSPSEWFFRAATYYDKAIYYLRVYLQDWSTSGPEGAGDQLDTHLDELDHVLGVTADEDNQAPPYKRRRVQKDQSPESSRDDLLIAVSILAAYEYLDQHKSETLQHLSGFHSLLTSGNLPEPLDPVERPWSRPDNKTLARRATFWNFARMDCAVAYISRAKCRINPDDHSLWRGAGLPIARDGKLSPRYFDMSSDERYWITEELASRAMIWILMKIMDMIAEREGTSRETKAQQAKRENAKLLMDLWHAALPPTFKPYAQVTGCSSASPHMVSASLSELLFSSAGCAAALQLYHFGRILLLLNQPLDAMTRTAAGHLRLFQDVVNQTRYHSREICGIALGSSRHLLSAPITQPLYLAGICLEADEDRRVVLDLLETMEIDTGHSTEYRRRDLKIQWGWES